MNELDREKLLICVKSVAPLDAEMVGDTTLNRIIDGANYHSLDEGHFIDPGQSIGLISGIVTLAQALLATGFWVNKKLEDRRLNKEKDKQSTIESVREALVKDEQINALLISNPELLSQLFDTLNELEQATNNTTE